MNEWVDLGELPEDHPMRNTPLGEIGATCRNRQQERARVVTGWAVASRAYNELAVFWRELNEWRAPLR